MHRLKLAAPVDKAQLQGLGIRPGAGVNFNVDEAHKVLEAPPGQVLADALGAYGVSAPIKKLQGGQDHHTGMLLGIDNEGGGPQMLHNYNEGFDGTRVEPLSTYAKATNLTAFEPSSTTKEQRLRAAAQALRNHETTKPGYPMKNLVLSGANGLVQRAPLPGGAKAALGRLLNSKAQVCPPGQDICSKLLPDAYAGQMGQEAAAKLFGVNDIKTQGNIGFTPKSVRAAPGMRDVAKYTVPKGRTFDAIKAGLRTAFKGKVPLSRLPA